MCISDSVQQNPILSVAKKIPPSILGKGERVSALWRKVLWQREGLELAREGQACHRCAAGACEGVSGWKVTGAADACKALKAAGHSGGVKSLAVSTMEVCCREWGWRDGGQLGLQDPRTVVIHYIALLKELYWDLFSGNKYCNLDLNCWGSWVTLPIMTAALGWDTDSSTEDSDHLHRLLPDCEDLEIVVYHPEGGHPQHHPVSAGCADFFL